MSAEPATVTNRHDPVSVEIEATQESRPERAAAGRTCGPTGGRPSVAMTNTAAVTASRPGRAKSRSPRLGSAERGAYRCILSVNWRTRPMASFEAIAMFSRISVSASVIASRALNSSSGSTPP
jgi:hypothetical protein